MIIKLNLTQYTILFMVSKEAMLSTKITIFEKDCQIRASKNISGQVKVTVTSPVGLMKCFLNVELCAPKLDQESMKLTMPLS